PFDRARFLEAGFEWSWPHHRSAGNFFAAPFLRSWHPQESAPALLLNTTDVQHGDRGVLSPFSLDELDPNRGHVRDIHDIADTPTWDLPVSTAVSLSARFPWLTPSGSVINQTRSITRLVDGGYFENSGAETAMDVVRRLRQLAQSDATL